ncbi:MAG: preprotein translocase subunit SecG [Patescibacteria group bacterium]|jgi:preprotein translocase subunit SecG|nr:preprotein translocase subunit SecG [bacterium]HQC49910.1 preprotein translocase subunit SecG [bacterium]
MLFWIKIGQVVIAILLMVAILLQNRGTGVGGVFGGTGGVYLTKRGIEKKLHIATIVLAVLFVVFSLLVFRFNS